MTKNFEAWKQNIKEDVLTNYFQSMAIAIYNESGPSNALVWVERARNFSANAAITAWLGRSILNELGRPDEAQLVHATALKTDPHYEVSAMRRIVNIQASTKSIPVVATLKLFDQSIATARDHGDVEVTLILLLQQATYCLMQNLPSTPKLDMLDEAARVIRPFGLFPDSTRQDIVLAAIDLALAATRANNPDLGISAIRLLVATSMPNEIDVGQLSQFAHLLIAASGQAHPEWQELQQNLVVLLERLVLVGNDGLRSLTSFVNQAFSCGAFELGEKGTFRALEIDPGNVALRVQIAKERWVRGNHEGAIIILETSPRHLTVAAYLAMYLSLCGRTDEALAIARTALAEAPDHRLVQNLAGMVLVANGYSAELLKHLASVTVSADGPVITLALALRALRRFDDALAQINRLTEPSSPLAQAISQTVKAAILEDMGQKTEAENLYRLVAKTANPTELLFHCQMRPTVTAQMVAGLRRGGMIFA